MPDDTETAPPEYDQNAIYDDNSPIQPAFMDEAVRTLMRSLPLEDAEPKEWAHRRMQSALNALSALHPRNEIEVMLGVQALSAYHAAAAGWRLGMNLRKPKGDSTRHFAAASAAARTFVSMLRVLERRQAIPLAIPVGRPPSREWPDPAPAETNRKWTTRCGRRDSDKPSETPVETSVWTPEALAMVDKEAAAERYKKENEGLDLANTEGILPCGGMYMPEHPTPQQAAYLERRLGLMYTREYHENLRKGITKMGPIRGMKFGDLVP